MPKKAGRPRKLGIVREPNGKPSRSDRVIHIQRKLDAIQKLAMDAEMGTPLGVLLTWERITKQQYEAGTWFAEARKAADGALGLPPRNPTAQDMNAVHGASNSIEDEDTIKAKRRAIDVYARAEDALGLNSARLRAMLWVCVYERRHDDHAQLLALIDGLNTIIAHRMTRRAA